HHRRKKEASYAATQPAWNCMIHESFSSHPDRNIIAITLHFNWGWVHGGLDRTAIGTIYYYCPDRRGRYVTGISGLAGVHEARCRRQGDPISPGPDQRICPAIRA